MKRKRRRRRRRGIGNSGSYRINVSGQWSVVIRQVVNVCCSDDAVLITATMNLSETQMTHLDLREVDESRGE